MSELVLNSPAQIFGRCEKFILRPLSVRRWQAAYCGADRDTASGGPNLPRSPPSASPSALFSYNIWLSVIPRKALGLHAPIPADGTAVIIATVRWPSIGLGRFVRRSRKLFVCIIVEVFIVVHPEVDASHILVSTKYEQARDSKVSVDRSL